jgi:hypothetical protein
MHESIFSTKGNAMHSVREAASGRMLSSAPTEIGSALYAAVVISAATGIDTEVAAAYGSQAVLFRCEADTKVDEADSFFPVIVHRDAIIPGVVD